VERGRRGLHAAALQALRPAFAPANRSPHSPPPQPNSYLYRDLDFGIDCDSRVALVGPNGAGKSTLLKLITGDLTPCVGVIQRHPHLSIGRYHQHRCGRARARAAAAAAAAAAAGARGAPGLRASAPRLSRRPSSQPPPFPNPLALTLALLRPLITPHPPSVDQLIPEMTVIEFFQNTYPNDKTFVVRRRAGADG
jgi:ATPase subunit of ABC transporter with duplicated ATPase domains